MNENEDDEAALAEQFAEIEQRFIGSLSDRLMLASGALREIEAKGDGGEVGAVARLYDVVHSLCGIAPMLGFSEIGEAARKVDNLLIAAYRGKRELTDSDIKNLRVLVEALQLSCSPHADRIGFEVLPQPVTQERANRSMSSLRR